MSSKRVAEQRMLSQLYKQKSLSVKRLRSEAYEHWLQDFYPMVEKHYQLIIDDVEGVNPTFDEFCKFFYYLVQSGCNIERFNRLTTSLK